MSNDALIVIRLDDEIRWKSEENLLLLKEQIIKLPFHTPIEIMCHHPSGAGIQSPRPQHVGVAGHQTKQYYQIYKTESFVYIEPLIDDTIGISDYEGPDNDLEAIETISLLIMEINTNISTNC